MLENVATTAPSTTTDTVAVSADLPIGEQELDLSQLEDLELFWGGVVEVFESAIQFENIAAVRGFDELNIDDVTGAEMFEALPAIFDELRELVERCEHEYIPDEQEIPDVELAQMQQLYNELLLLRNHIVNTYEDAVEIELVPELEAVYGTGGSPIDVTTQSVPVDTTPTPILVPKAPRVELPSDADMAALMKRVHLEPFYTQEERSKAVVLCEAYHRSVAMEQPTAESYDTFQKLESYIQQIERDPEVTTVFARAEEIARRVVAGADQESKLVEMVTADLATMQRLLRDPEKNKQNIFDLYAELVHQVRMRESEWLMVCGVRVPMAGRAGIEQARFMREALLLQKDRELQLVHDPHKRVLLDKLITKLGNITPAGFSGEVDIPMVYGLARQIDLPGKRKDALPLELIEETPVASKADRIRPSLDKTHKVMSIVVESEEGALEIQVADSAKRHATERIHDLSEPSLLQRVASAVGNTVSSLKVVDVMEKRDPINQAVPTKLPRFSPLLTKRKETILTEQYLHDPAYQAFIEEQFGGPAAFERLLDTTVTQIEKDTVDVFERWLQEEHQSAFAFLRTRTVSDVRALANDPRVRQRLREEYVKYETFIVWADLVPEMEAVVETTPDMTFGELYARWMIETEIIARSAT
ncbi:hypothetical protein KC906_04305 [Candidatus Kaiserbacteria bacterium]|nr:hypothetical protein [Candidatus Kaiserbacteria bacterium]